MRIATKITNKNVIIMAREEKRYHIYDSSIFSVDEDEAREKIRYFVQSWGINELYLCVDPAICREAACRPAWVSSRIR